MAANDQEISNPSSSRHFVEDFDSLAEDSAATLETQEHQIRFLHLNHEIEERETITNHGFQAVKCFIDSMSDLSKRFHSRTARLFKGEIDAFGSKLTRKGAEYNNKTHDDGNKPRLTLELLKANNNRICEVVYIRTRQATWPRWRRIDDFSLDPENGTTTASDDGESLNNNSTVVRPYDASRVVVPEVALSKEDQQRAISSDAAFFGDDYRSSTVQELKSIVWDLQCERCGLIQRITDIDCRSFWSGRFLDVNVYALLNSYEQLQITRSRIESDIAILNTFLRIQNKIPLSATMTQSRQTQTEITSSLPYLDDLYHDFNVENDLRLSSHAINKLKEHDYNNLRSYLPLDRHVMATVLQLKGADIQRTEAIISSYVHATS